MRRIASKNWLDKKIMVKVAKKLFRILLNYFKLFLIPLVFLFMLLALIFKTIKILIEKATV